MGAPKEYLQLMFLMEKHANSYRKLINVYIYFGSNLFVQWLVRPKAMAGLFNALGH